ncbi:permease prefix domain 1-containing protein [Pseudidiomarina insulisalsae]|uniref:DUF4153 domain-containing protein n=1 Tax=Pseudidiomarina insulisalsae TaxID=575789 RepID=A0A432YQ23_9GAMM|nr:permease prefix domain 1-containing protein [Pseudidiomarina insulisalsae]RUO63127.1 hypothetical protein CWI71_02580 [Pseudidiomarina insulisalsae]
MTTSSFDMDARIAEWRAFLAKHAAFDSDDHDELESHLRDHIDALTQSGLQQDEAFLIATKRLGRLHDVSREYAEVHSQRLWRHLVFSDASGSSGTGWLGYRELLMVMLLALAAALMVKLPELGGWSLTDDSDGWFYARNLTLFAFPFIGIYWVWKRELGGYGVTLVLGTVLVVSLLLNLYPLVPESDTGVLAVLHLPLVLWFIVGVLYTGDYWRSLSRRMDFIRFSGEFAIYYVLIALGGAALTGLTLGLYAFIGYDVEWLAQAWMIPCGAAGAVVVAAFLVEAKQSAIENIAPVLARIFTPLVAFILMVYLLTMLFGAQTFAVQREALILLDLMLVLVLGLVLYSVSSRDTVMPVGVFDYLQLALIIVALIVDLVALVAISDRILSMGLSPNRVAALGENLILFVSLSGYAWFYYQFVTHKRGFYALERWQTGYVPVYALWAAVVVLIFPPLFNFS